MRRLSLDEGPALTEASRLRSGLEADEWMESVRLPAIEVVAFTRQLQVMMNSGIPIHRALEVLSEQTVSSQAAEVFFTVQRLVLEGHYLSRALGRFPRVFPGIYVGLVRVGEQTGGLALVLSMLSQWLERDLEVVHKLKSALTYPLVVLLVSSGAVLLLMNLLGPLFAGMFSERGQPLPWPTRAVLSLIALQGRPSFWFALGLAVLVGLRWTRSSWGGLSGRAQVYTWAGGVPGLGPLLLAAAWSRYCAALAILVTAGVVPQRSYRFAADVSGDPRLILDSNRLVQTILAGETVAEHMQRHPQIYPHLVASSLELADESGQGRLILEFLTRFYRDDLEMRLEVLQKLIEPVLLLGTASALLLLILALMLPLYGPLQGLA